LQYGNNSMLLGPTDGSVHMQSLYFKFYNSLQHSDLLITLLSWKVAQLVEAWRYKSEGCGFDFRWPHCNFFVYIILQHALRTWGRVSR
jgi:hypothetical protein